MPIDICNKLCKGRWYVLNMHDWHFSSIYTRIDFFHLLLKLWSPLTTMQRETASPLSPETRCHHPAGWSGSSPWWWSLPSLCSASSCCWLSWSTGGKVLWTTTVYKAGVNSLLSSTLVLDQDLDWKDQFSLSTFLVLYQLLHSSI